MPVPGAIERLEGIVCGVGWHWPDFAREGNFHIFFSWVRITHANA
jgi:hypothetical protein